MKIPGLDDALKKLDKFDEMQPVLEEIRDNLDTLVELQTLALMHQANMISSVKVRDELEKI